MSGGYNSIYENVSQKLITCDFSEAAERLGLSLQPDGGFVINFLGREYIINSQGVYPIDRNPVNINNRSVLAYYILSRGHGEPAFSYVTLSYLAGSGINFGNIKWMTDPLREIFEGNYQLFSDTMFKLGAVFGGILKSGGHSWLLNILPKIPLQIVYNEKDEEFPCEVLVKFDENASRYMEFECLAFLQGCLVRAMIRTAQTGDTTGWV